MFLVASVTTTNTLAEICENIGADWQDIVPTLRLDKRIGQHAYLTPGLGIAGGNLERDLNTIVKLGQQYTTDTYTVQAWLKNSSYRRDWVLRCLQQHVLTKIPQPNIAILGLAYKPNTHSLKNSPSIALIKQLMNYSVQAHDPIVKDEHGTHALRYEKLEETLKDADVLVVMTPCDEYKNLSVNQMSQSMRGRIIIDPHRILDLSDINSDYLYLSLGQGAIHIKDKEVSYA